MSALALLLAVAGGSAQSLDDITITVQGYLFSAEDEPLAGVVRVLGSDSETTAGPGRLFSIDCPKGGLLLFEAEGNTYEAYLDDFITADHNARSSYLFVVCSPGRQVHDSPYIVPIRKKMYDPLGVVARYRTDIREVTLCRVEAYRSQDIPVQFILHGACLDVEQDMARQLILREDGLMEGEGVTEVYDFDDFEEVVVFGNRGRYVFAMLTGDDD